MRQTLILGLGLIWGILASCQDAPVYHHIDASDDLIIDFNEDAHPDLPDILDMWAIELPPLGNVGGVATSAETPDDPFLQFIPSLPLSELREASQGREFFVAQWTIGPGPRETLDGLGPLSITNSCANCHPSTARAPSLLPKGETGVGVLLRLAQNTGQSWQPDPTYGNQLQTQGTVEVPAEGRITWFERKKNTLTYPVFAIDALGYGPVATSTKLGARIAPSLIGMGLLNLVSDSTILERVPTSQEPQSISGRPHWLQTPQGSVIGRFGWKGIHATLKAQTAGAFAGDMGLSTPIFPTPNCTTQQTACLARQQTNAPDIPMIHLEQVVAFLQRLAVPDRRTSSTQPDFILGRKIFHRIGCEGCHRETLQTPTDAKPSILAGQSFHPYTDLLLHDMGDALSDIQEGDASPSEWRTPPLWGLGIIMSRPHGRLLHDGRALTIDEAIRWHAGEAKNAQQRYLMLTEEDQQALLYFLNMI